MTDVGKRGDRDTVDEFLSPRQKNLYPSGLSLFSSVEDLNFLTRPHPERFAFATLFTVHPASRRTETPAVTLRDARLQACFASCSKSPVIRISPDLPRLPCRLSCRMGEARGVIRGELYVENMSQSFPRETRTVHQLINPTTLSIVVVFAFGCM
jgi:hypothetical protein